MLPDVDAGIFLDNDMLVLQDPAILWDRFKLFTPFTAMAVAPVEAHYSREMVSTEQAIKGSCVILNLTNLSYKTNALDQPTLCSTNLCFCF